MTKHGEVKTIFGQTATLFRGGDPPVYLLKDGRFAVPHANSHKTFKTAQAAVRFGDPRRGSLKLILYNRHSDLLRVVEAIDFGDHKIVSSDGKAFKLPRWGLVEVFVIRRNWRNHSAR